MDDENLDLVQKLQRARERAHADAVNQADRDLIIGTRVDVAVLHVWMEEEIRQRRQLEARVNAHDRTIQRAIGFGLALSLIMPVIITLIMNSIAR